MHGRRSGPGVQHRVVNLRGSKRVTGHVDAARHQHTAVGQQRRCVIRSRALHRRGLEEAVGGRAVSLRRGHHSGFVCPATDEDAAVVEKDRRRPGAPGARATGCHPRVGRHLRQSGSEEQTARKEQRGKPRRKYRRALERVRGVSNHRRYPRVAFPHVHVLGLPSAHRGYKKQLRELRLPLCLAPSPRKNKAY